jgi:hypothetical protein
MFRRWLTRGLPGLLWSLTLGASATLLALVLLAPLLAGKEDAGEVWPRLVGLFARDPLVRRTALASAIGLVVTASVFFRPPRMSPAAPRVRAEKHATSNSVGA